MITHFHALSGKYKCIWPCLTSCQTADINWLLAHFALQHKRGFLAQFTKPMLNVASWKGGFHWNKTALLVTKGPMYTVWGRTWGLLGCVPQQSAWNICAPYREGCQCPIQGCQCPMLCARNALIITCAFVMKYICVGVHTCIHTYGKLYNRTESHLYTCMQTHDNISNLSTLVAFNTA